MRKATHRRVSVWCVVFGVSCLVCRVWLPCLVAVFAGCRVGSDLHTSLCSSVDTSARGSISAAGPLSAFFAAVQSVTQSCPTLCDHVLRRR